MIYDFLMAHAAENPVSFHMPGHKGAQLYERFGYDDFLKEIMNCDITEIVGADNLFQMEGIILATMAKYSKLYDVIDSYLLVNGSSCGLIASILACVGDYGKLIMARNCHKSVFNSLTIADCEPAYIRPEAIEEYGILGSVSPKEVEKAIKENPTADAVIVVSPNYYGICSDIQAIAEVVHKYNKILIVDQAHGAHLKFFSQFAEEYGYPKAAEDQGADLVINSIHKTLGSFTQTAILNVCSDRVDERVLEDKLQVMESTSPSYPLMASLDINADLLFEHGEELIREWAENLEYFYEEAAKIKGLEVIKHPMLDRTKINIDMSAYDIDGNELEELLLKDGIYIELVTGNIVMAMTGIGNTREHFDRFLASLRKIASEHEYIGKEKSKKIQSHVFTRELERVLVPAEREYVHIDDAEGRICAQSIIPYPPGIPIACPGEVIDRDLIEYVKKSRAAGEKVMGMNANHQVLVGVVAPENEDMYEDYDDEDVVLHLG
ncbi:MAG: aminotransferase class I/II-fold pyridoxal phosphate-dependent enzyme [Firmicutes bacterium]|nr:aminotransferase class I/II-fold pyridoxal phosphate-dependent enzyme [Bacillota bacterium]